MARRNVSRRDFIKSTATAAVAPLVLGASKKAQAIYNMGAFWRLPANIYIGSANAASSAGNNITVNVPTGTKSGDLMVAFFCCSTNSGTMTIGAPWTTVLSATTLDARIAYKIASSSEPASYTFSHPTGTNPLLKGGIYVFRGVSSLSVGTDTNISTSDTTYSLTNFQNGAFPLSFEYSAATSLLTHKPDAMSSIDTNKNASALSYAVYFGTTGKSPGTVSAKTRSSSFMITSRAAMCVLIPSGNTILSGYSESVICLPGDDVMTVSTYSVIAGSGLVTPPSGGLVSINGGSWVTSGSVVTGDTLKFRVTAQATSNTQVSNMFSVGNTSFNLTSYTKTTLSATSQTIRCAPSLLVTSLSYTVSQGSGPVSVPAGGEISINGGAWGTSGTVMSGDSFQVRATSAATWNSTKSALFTIAGANFNLIADTTNYYIFSSASTESFVVPLGVTSMSMLVVGASGGGGCSKQGILDIVAVSAGGGGGGLSYSNSLAVTPLETLTLQSGMLGASCFGGTQASVGGGDAGQSFVKRGATTLVLANGGKGGYQNTGGAGGSVSGAVGTVTYSGGAGSAGDNTNRYAGGGGGTALPSGNGIAGVNGTTAWNGGGGGQYANYSSTGWSTVAATAGSTTISGLAPGGGAGGVAGSTYGDAAQGRSGVVVLIWGGRTFSSSTTY